MDLGGCTEVRKADWSQIQVAALGVAPPIVIRELASVLWTATSWRLVTAVLIWRETVRQLPAQFHHWLIRQEVQTVQSCNEPLVLPEGQGRDRKQRQVSLHKLYIWGLEKTDAPLTSILTMNRLSFAQRLDLGEPLACIYRGGSGRGVDCPSWNVLSVPESFQDLPVQVVAAVDQVRVTVSQEVGRRRRGWSLAALKHPFQHGELHQVQQPEQSLLQPHLVHHYGATNI